MLYYVHACEGFALFRISFFGAVIDRIRVVLGGVAVQVAIQQHPPQRDYYSSVLPVDL